MLKRIYLSLLAGLTFFYAFNVYASSESLLITKIQVQGDSAKDEFIEIFNPTAKTINLENYKLIKKTKSGNSQNLVTKFPTLNIETKQNIIITPKKGYMGNLQSTLHYSNSNSIAQNNTIILLSPQKTIIDQVGYGTTAIAETSPAPNPKSGEIIVRKKDHTNTYIDTNNNLQDFRILKKKETTGSTDTKGLPPILNPPPPTPNKTILPPNSLLINEILPSPNKGNSEWMEIYNNTNSHISLDKVTINEGSGRITKLQGKLYARSYFLVKKINGNLNNSGDKIELKYKGILLDSMEYGLDSSTSAPLPNKGQSLIRKKETIPTQNSALDFVITLSPTPGEKNIFTTPIPAKHKPKTDIRFPISNPPKNAIITETKNTPQPTTTHPKKIPLCLYPKPSKPPIPAPTPKNKHQTKPSKIKNKKYPKIIISEFIPNPIGNDNKEWIELYNPNDFAINLSGWKIDDEPNQSKPYFFKEKTVIPAKNYYLLKRSESKITLNNTSDSINLFNPNNKETDFIAYADLDEGVAFALDVKGKWEETTMLTPKEKNKIIPPQTKLKKKNKSTNFITLHGQISALPGQIYKNSLFIEPQGFEIYSQKSNFPKLEIGQTITVFGKTTSKPKKIILSKPENIKIKHQWEEIKPKEISINQLSDKFISNLISIQGIVLEVKTNKLYLDDSNGEILVYASKFKLPKIQPGWKIKITGIVNYFKQEYRITPRNKQDITILSKPTAPTKDSKNKEATQSIPTPFPDNYLLLGSSFLNLALGLKVFSLKQKQTVPQKNS